MTIRKFPAELNTLDWNSTKTIKWDTEVQTAGSGKVRTMTNLLLPNWTISTKFKSLTNDQYRTLFGFVALVKGAFEPFLWLDPEDHEERKIQLPTVTTGTYQAVMKMGDYVEPVEYIEDVTVYVDGKKQQSSLYTIVNGCIVFRTDPASTAVVTADYTYYWKVMFKDDEMEIENVFTDINKSKSFKLTTVR
jgi:hypothetical protein